MRPVVEMATSDPAAIRGWAVAALIGAMAAPRITSKRVIPAGAAANRRAGPGVEVELPSIMIDAVLFRVQD